ncbi:MAG: hypothetical protein IKN26_02030, partial [Eubacterium sp.]|nr:hypothetical protein [Eubacterium sp.]
KEDIAEIKQAVKAYQKERSQIAAKIKKATDENSIYYRAAKPYLDAVKLLNQAENYTHLDEIEGLYQSALARAENV